MLSPKSLKSSVVSKTSLDEVLGLLGTIYPDGPLSNNLSKFYGQLRVTFNEVSIDTKVNLESTFRTVLDNLVSLVEQLSMVKSDLSDIRSDFHEKMKEIFSKDQEIFRLRNLLPANRVVDHNNCSKKNKESSTQTMSREFTDVTTSPLLPSPVNIPLASPIAGDHPDNTEVLELRGHIKSQLDNISALCQENARLTVKIHSVLENLATSPTRLTTSEQVKALDSSSSPASTVTPSRPKLLVLGEGSAPLFDRKEVKPHINLPLEIDLEKSKKKRRKRSKSRERSSSPYRKRHRSPYSTSPERKHRSHRSRRSESPEERRRRRARSRSRSTSSERRHYVSRRSHASDRRNDRSSSSDSSDDNSRSERRKQYYRERRERDAHYYQEMLPPRDMMIGPHGPMMPRMMMNPMIPWGYPPYPRPPLRGMPPYRPSWEATRPTIVYNSRPPKPPAIEASTSENSTNYVPTTTS